MIFRDVNRWEFGYCPVCNERNGFGSRYCNECGTKLSWRYARKASQS